MVYIIDNKEKKQKIDKGMLKLLPNSLKEGDIKMKNETRNEKVVL